MRIKGLPSARSGEAYQRALMSASSEGIAVVAEDGLIEDVTPALGRMLSFVPEDLVGRNLVELLAEADQESALALITSGGLSASPTPAQWRLARSDGNWVHAEAQVTDMRSDADVRGIVVAIRDVSRTVSLEQRLRHDAFRDSLTGLGNRVMLLDRARIALSGSEERRAGVAVLFLDLDDFKTINDSMGHAAGDELLTRVAKRLRECLRPEDAAARLGGDEFAILLENLHSSEQAGEVAQRVLDSLRVPFQVGGSQVRVQTSIGIALGGGEAEGAEELVRNADVAMYAAKARGKGRSEYFVADMRAGALARLELQDALAAAIDRGEFVLHYQPIVDLKTREISGAEALLRWRDRQRGLVPPTAFIALAEEAGLMDTIGRWVLRTAVAQMRRWQLDTGRELRINVNLSARQLDQLGIVGFVADLLANTGLAGDALVLEITEEVFMQTSDHLMTNLNELKELGVKLAIDDFGTGYSSLSYLRRFPVDYLKIDKSFIDDVNAGEHGADLARAVTEIGHALGLSVVAEGIERAEQLPGLHEMGCDYGQGYLFARPLDTAAMGTFLQRGPVVDAGSAPAADAPAPDGARAA